MSNHPSSIHVNPIRLCCFPERPCCCVSSVFIVIFSDTNATQSFWMSFLKICLSIGLIFFPLVYYAVQAIFRCKIKFCIWLNKFGLYICATSLTQKSNDDRILLFFLYKGCKPYKSKLTVCTSWVKRQDHLIKSQGTGKHLQRKGDEKHRRAFLPL